MAISHFLTSRKFTPKLNITANICAPAFLVPLQI